MWQIIAYPGNACRMRLSWGLFKWTLAVSLYRNHAKAETFHRIWIWVQKLGFRQLLKHQDCNTFEVWLMHHRNRCHCSPITDSSGGIVKQAKTHPQPMVHKGFTRGTLPKCVNILRMDPPSKYLPWYVEFQLSKKSEILCWYLNIIRNVNQESLAVRSF